MRDPARRYVAPVEAIVTVVSQPGQRVTHADVLRALLDEALTARAADCEFGHRGPIRAGMCGHCSGTAPTT